MTIQILQSYELELPGSLALWRSQYPQFGALVDGGAPPAKALRFLGLALWQDGRLDDAAEVMKAASSVAPDPTVLGELGSVLWAAGRKIEARGQFTASLRLAPNQSQVWLNVAGLSNELGDKTMAERAFRTVLELDPTSADAAAGLGLLCIERRRYAEAAEMLTAAVERGVTAMPVYACLGQTLFLLGDFSRASAALEKAARACPGEARIVQKCAQSRLIEALIRGSVVEAIEIYLSTAGRFSEDLVVVCRKAFQILCGYGHKGAAIRLGEVLRKRTPDDPIVAYHLDALLGVAHVRTPDHYLTACFDRYASEFDRHLVEILDYRLPEKLPALLEPIGFAFKRILDLGCGTGLAAPYLKSLGGHVTGVDISPGMLEKARERDCFNETIESEATAFLTRGTEPFDLIVSLDVLVYFGDLSALFAAVASRLAPGGVFAFSHETLRGANYAFLPSGRFAHDPDYVKSLYGAHFSEIASQSTTVRFEANQQVEGRLVLLRRG